MKLFKALATAIDTKNPFTNNHSINVGKLCAGIARNLGWNEREIKLLVNAAMMHDIGKVNVPAAIISKPGKLNELEMRAIEKHPAYGKAILKKIELPGMDTICRSVYKHHERWNGTGYPRQLKRKKISMEARVIAVADSFDAMTSTRHYKKRKTRKTAFEEILKLSGTLYDPEVVEAFEKYARVIWPSVRVKRAK